MILFITMTNVVALKCPTSKECYCKLRNDNQTASINCTMNNNSVFNIYVDHKIYNIIGVSIYEIINILIYTHIKI